MADGTAASQLSFLHRQAPVPSATATCHTPVVVLERRKQKQLKEPHLLQLLLRLRQALHGQREPFTLALHATVLSHEPTQRDLCLCAVVTDTIKTGSTRHSKKGEVIQKKCSEDDEK